MTTDTERLDWRDRNLMHLSHEPATNSVEMGVICVRGQRLNEARGSAGGPCYFRVNHRSIREAVDEAMRWPNEQRKDP